uniref:Putative Cob(I)yrinic acid a,c-diamide adenosyltransferase n=1 Tax=Magnetococcus massalia (strain MO-1) TaxID=451514 RepID=A0A1S7LQ30_MAGMO
MSQPQSAKQRLNNTSPKAHHRVILLHGLLMPSTVMQPLARKLKARGFAASCYGYPTRKKRVDALADSLAAHIRHLPEAPHLVGHSMGGVVILRTLQRHPELAVQRVVALGSPFQGSSCAHALSKKSWGRWLLGESYPQGLDGQLSSSQGGQKACVPKGREVGVVAGHWPYSFTRLVIPGVPEEGDGVVGLNETRLAGAQWCSLNTNHTAILGYPHTAGVVAHFLTHGIFPTDLET